MGKLLIIVGIVCILGGVLIIYLPKIPSLGKLPGDIKIEKENDEAKEEKRIRIRKDK